MSIENQYQQYLKLVNLNEGKMHPIQAKETRRAFFGAAGQILILFRDEIGAMEEDDAIQAMDDLKNEVSHFWQKENNLTN